MHDGSGDFTIVFNGEIYNFPDLRRELAGLHHEFRSHSDTEVILAAYREWGVDCLARLNGMWAFALYDAPRQRVFLARDRAGEKPLFYSISRGELRFASELKGLMADPAMPRIIDAASFDCFLTMGYVPGDRCILQGVKKLPPAHALLFDLDSGDSRIWPHWRVPELQASPTDEGALLDELEALLQDSVGRQMVADVPVGVLLSGGVDSSLVTAMAVRGNSHVKTFTIRFPGFAKFDETTHARLIAEHFGTEHVELDAGVASVDLLPLLARQFDEPMADSSMMPTFLISQLIREHCTVALGGDGGDELFGGYTRYSRILWLQEKFGRFPCIARAPVASAAERFLPSGFAGRNWLTALSVDFDHSLPWIGSFFDRRDRTTLMTGVRPWQLSAESIREARLPETPDLLQRATRMDFANYLPEDILVKVDRASMLNSLEVRAPLLDHRLIEFAYGKVPSSLKATATSRKVLLKKLCGRVLPPNFDRQRKQGFSIPLADWLQRGPWHDFFRDTLMNADDSPLDKRFVRRLFDRRATSQANSERLLALVLFELWRKEYRASF